MVFILTMKKIAFTFDDGPHTHFTPLILDILKTYNISATFFVQGIMLEKNHDIIERMINEGHEIGNHTWNHYKLTDISDIQKVKEEITSVSNYLLKNFNYKQVYARPPYGWTNKNIQNIYKENNLKTIAWDIDSKDWTGMNFIDIAYNILSEITDDCIILMHDLNGRQLKTDKSNTIKTLEILIPRLIEMGFQIVKISDLKNPIEILPKFINK